MQQTETTPWYPTARLYRQPEPGDWAGVMERVSEDIKEYRSTQWGHAIQSKETEFQPLQLITV
jgi:hypothetical protein